MTTMQLLRQTRLDLAEDLGIGQDVVSRLISWAARERDNVECGNELGEGLAAAFDLYVNDGEIPESVFDLAELIFNDEDEW